MSIPRQFCFLLSKYELLGLNLLYLLSQNRIAEFHTELELLPADQLQTNKYISYPLTVEQYLMDGMYSKVIASRKASPFERYFFIMEALFLTVRAEIALCLEKAYHTVTFKDAAKKLHFISEEEAKNFGALRGWKMRGNQFVFIQDVVKKKEKIQSVNMAKQAVGYAKELVMIV